nr:hypothetical protein [Tanacetum cinerariifolium]
MGAYEVDGTQSSVVVRDKDARIQKKSNGLVTSEKEPVKTVRPKKMPKSQRNGLSSYIGIAPLPVSCSLQALSNLNYLFSGFMDYLWSCKLNISNFGPANRKNLPMDDMPYSCLINYPKHFAMIARIWM